MKRIHGKFLFAITLFTASIGASFVSAFEERVDFAVMDVQNPRIITRDNRQGLLFPFLLKNNGVQKYRAVVSMKCLGGAFLEIFSQKPGLKKQYLFLPFNDSEREQSHLNALKNHKEPTLDLEEPHPFRCSIEIFNMPDVPGYTNASDPADGDLSNNSVTFTLYWENEAYVTKNISRPKTSLAEKEKANYQPLAEEELELYKKLSKEKCLNILLSSQNRGTYYNGELLDHASDAHIAGDRLAYIEGDVSGKRVIVDGENFGLVSEDSSYQFPISLELNKKHFAFVKGIDPKAGKYKMVFDGKVLRPKIGYLPGMRLEGNFVFYQVSKGERRFGYANNKNIGENVVAYDGKNIVKRGPDLTLSYNGKPVGHSRRKVALKDGHFGFIDLLAEDEQLLYDGKRFGTAIAVFIEKDHMAYLSADKNSADPAHFIYDGKNFGIHAGENPSLSGDHFAFIRDTREFDEEIGGPAKNVVNIDGNDYPGSHFSYVEISEKGNNSECL